MYKRSWPSYDRRRINSITYGDLVNGLMDIEFLEKLSTAANKMCEICSEQIDSFIESGSGSTEKAQKKNRDRMSYYAIEEACKALGIKSIVKKPEVKCKMIMGFEKHFNGARFSPCIDPKMSDGFSSTDKIVDIKIHDDNGKPKMADQTLKIVKDMFIGKTFDEWVRL